MVTKDEIKDPQNLNIWLKVNGEYRQTRQHQDDGVRRRRDRLVVLAVFHHGAGRHHRHRHAVGRGARHEAAEVPQVGDVVELGCDGLGTQKQKVVKARA